MTTSAFDRGEASKSNSEEKKSQINHTTWFSRSIGLNPVYLPMSMYCITTLVLIAYKFKCRDATKSSPIISRLPHVPKAVINTNRNCADSPFKHVNTLN